MPVWRDLRLRWKLLAGLGAILALMVAQSAFTAWTLLATRESNQRVLNSLLAIQTADRALQGLINMETGYRGYLLAGADEFLEPYDAGRADSQAALADLRRQAADDPPQLARWQEIERRAATWQREIAEPGIALRRDGSSDAASAEQVAAFVASQRGKQQFDAIRRAFAEAIQAEQRRFARSEAASHEADRHLWLVLLGGSAVAIAVALLIALLQEGYIAGAMARIAASAGRLADGDLGRRIGLAQRDEIGATAAAFDRMADQLQATIQHAQTERATLASVMGSMRDGLLVLDDDRRLCYANQRASELLGVEVALSVGMSGADVLARVRPALADPEQVAAGWRRALSHPGDAPTFPVRLAGPPQRELLAQLFPVAGGALPRRLGLLLRDVTQEHELARAKDELLGVVSHELRTPVASLVGFTELLLTREYAEPRRREFLGVMLQEGRRLTALINDFLDLQRMESGAQRIAPVPTPLRPLAQHAVATAADDPLREVVLDVPDDLPPVLADPDRVQQVFTNLLSNARKYSPAGGEVRVSARRVGGDLVEVAVADQGLGIPPEALPHMFERFYRVTSPDRRHIRGTGLGLAIVRNIVEAHGGLITAESAGVGQGSTFRFTLPVAEVAIASRAPAAAPPAPGPAPAGGHVLVVEDDQSFAAWLSETLSGAGYAVRVAPSGEEALAAVAASRPAAVLLNLSLGGSLDGWDMLAVLRNRPDTATLPVIVVSGREEHARGRALGVADYLVKPASADAVLRALHRLGVTGERAVLVVEDDPAMREAVVATLSGAGFRGTSVGSGEEALARLEREAGAYGLLVLDLGLPGIDGFAVLEAVRRRPDGGELPVLVLTGRTLGDEQKRRLAARAVEVLGKRDGVGVPVVEAVARALRGTPPAPLATPERGGR